MEIERIWEVEIVFLFDRNHLPMPFLFHLLQTDSLIWQKKESKQRKSTIKIFAKKKKKFTHPYYLQNKLFASIKNVTTINSLQASCRLFVKLFVVVLTLYRITFNVIDILPFYFFFSVLGFWMCIRECAIHSLAINIHILKMWMCVNTHSLGISPFLVTYLQIITINYSCSFVKSIINYCF